jgi:hypothetical protein
MTDLTEQWKKGELPSGWYWVEGCRDKEIYAYTSEYLNHMYRPKNSDRIIEQVPSYEEWKALNGNMDSVMQTNQALCKKLAELKELLKRAETQIIAYKNNDTLPERAFYEKEVEELLGKIDEALQ